jgi:hypothetical protein
MDRRKERRDRKEKKAQCPGVSPFSAFLALPAATRYVKTF